MILLYFQSEIDSFHSAAHSGNLSKVKELMGKNKRLVYARDSSGVSALHKASNEGHVEIVKHLLTENQDSAKITDNVSCVITFFVFDRDTTEV